MKIFLLIFTILLSLNAAKIDEFAQKINYLRDYKTALTIAQKENKMIMLLVVADYCPWCKKFEKKTLMHKSIKKLVNKNFIPIVIDKLKDKGSFPKKYASPLIPAIYFINPSNEKAVHEVIAYKTRKDFILDINKALKNFKNKTEL